MKYNLIILFIVQFNKSFSQNPVTDLSIQIIKETTATEPVQTDPDDPAVWIHPTYRELSLIIATDKAARIGGVYSFDLNGKIVQRIENLDRPNNVDIEYDFQFNRTHSIDLIVVTERYKKRLRIFSIDISTRRLYELTGNNTYVFTDSEGKEAEPMGIGLYKRKTDNKIFAIVSRKSGPNHGYIGQYEFVSNGQTVDIKLIRYFGDRQGQEIESILVDDQLGFIYYSDEHYGIRKYYADPMDKQTKQIGFINTTNIWRGDSEGIALYETTNQRGYLILTDQIKNGSIFHIFNRDGNNSYIKSIRTYADSTDGIEATSQSLTKNFPHGFLIVMNKIHNNFLLYDWRSIENEIVLVRNHVYCNHFNLFYFILEFCLVWASLVS